MKLWLGVLGVAALGFAAFAYFGSSRTTTPLATNTANTASPSGSQEAEPPVTSSPAGGVYLTYAGDLTAGEGRRILFFHAPWCPQCRALEASIQREGVPEGVTILKVDYDTNQALRQRYGVTIQTTLVEIDGAGTSLGKYVAYEEPSLPAVLRHFGVK